VRNALLQMSGWNWALAAKRCAQVARRGNSLLDSWSQRQGVVQISTNLNKPEINFSVRKGPASNQPPIEFRLQRTEA